jgi:hypothetical protein
MGLEEMREEKTTKDSLRDSKDISMNTYAMMRANINRLFRRTWNTTKDPRRLRDHIDLYVWYHNSELTE